MWCDRNPLVLWTSSMCHPIMHLRDKAWNPAFRFIVSVTTWYKQGLKPGISFHCLRDYLVQTRPETQHFVSLSLQRLGTNKAWNPAFHFIVSGTTCYKQGLKPDILFHCPRDYLLQTRPETRYFISLSLGRLGTNNAWNPAFHFIVSGTTWYKQGLKPDISFHCLWDYLLQTRPETRHFISLSPGLLGTNKAWNPAFHFIVSGTSWYKQNLKHGISFHCLWDYLVQTRPDTRHFISLSLGLLGIQTRHETRHLISSPGLSKIEVLSQGFLFFIAGFDNTAGALAVFLHTLACHPEVQDKAHQEVDDVLGGKVSAAKWENRK